MKGNCILYRTLRYTVCLVPVYLNRHGQSSIYGNFRNNAKTHLQAIVELFFNVNFDILWYDRECKISVWFLNLIMFFDYSVAYCNMLANML